MRIFRHYIPWKLFFLVVVEAMILFGSVYAGQAIQWIGFSPIWLGIEPIYPKALTFLLIALISLYVGKLYDLSLHLRKRELLLRVGYCFVVISILVAFIGFLIPLFRLSRGAYIFSLTLSFVVIVSFRFFYYWAINTKQLQEKVLILGNGKIAWLLSAELQSGNNPGFELLGFVAEQTSDLPTQAQEIESDERLDNEPKIQ